MPSVRTVVFRGFLQAQHLAADVGSAASDEELEPDTKEFNSRHVFSSIRFHHIFFAAAS